MYFVNSYFTVAIYFSAIFAVIAGILYWSKSIVADKRMQRMMLSCGIDESCIENADELLNIDMDPARSRCRNCPATELCDRWLAGECVASNSFCPNAWHFARVAASQP